MSVVENAGDGYVPRFVVLLVALFTNCLTKVCMNGTTCHNRAFNEFVSQVSVISPLFFVFFVNSPPCRFYASRHLCGRPCASLSPAIQ